MLDFQPTSFMSSVISLYPCTQKIIVCSFRQAFKDSYLSDSQLSVDFVLVCLDSGHGARFGANDEKCK